jgi:hypothetical protein
MRNPSARVRNQARRLRNAYLRVVYRLRSYAGRVTGRWPVPRSRIDLLNLLAARYRLRNYLEIGVSDPLACHDKIAIRSKLSVDPAPRGPITHATTSDEFFASYTGPPFDLIFVDGLHVEEQALRDIENSLRHLSERGLIVVHDCSPDSEACASEHYDGVSNWSGTTWKAWARLRASRPDLDMRVVGIDRGCGVINPRGSQEPFVGLPTNLDYAFLAANRQALLQLETPESFAAAL